MNKAVCRASVTLLNKSLNHDVAVFNSVNNLWALRAALFVREYKLWEKEKKNEASVGGSKAGKDRIQSATCRIQRLVSLGAFCLEENCSTQLPIAFASCGKENRFAE